MNHKYFMTVIHRDWEYLPWLVTEHLLKMPVPSTIIDVLAFGNLHPREYSSSFAKKAYLNITQNMALFAWLWNAAVNACIGPTKCRRYKNLTVWSLFSYTLSKNRRCGCQGSENPSCYLKLLSKTVHDTQLSLHCFKWPCRQL